MLRPKCPQTETARPKYPVTVTAQTETARRNRSDPIGQTEKSRTLRNLPLQEKEQT